VTVPLSIDALRLAGRLKHRITPIPLTRVEKICEFPYEKRAPACIAEELVVFGYLIFEEYAYHRTSMPYTKEMSRQLLAMVQIFNQRERERMRPVNIVRTDLEPGVAYWFGYCQHPVYATGRRHYLEDDE
jgi:hypothetical protein